MPPPCGSSCSRSTSPAPCGCGTPCTACGRRPGGPACRPSRGRSAGGRSRTGWARPRPCPCDDTPHRAPPLPGETSAPAGSGKRGHAACRLSLRGACAQRQNAASAHGSAPSPGSAWSGRARASGAGAAQGQQGPAPGARAPCDTARRHAPWPRAPGSRGSPRSPAPQRGAGGNPRSSWGRMDRGGPAPGSRGHPWGPQRWCGTHCIGPWSCGGRSSSGWQLSRVPCDRTGPSAPCPLWPSPTGSRAGPEGFAPGSSSVRSPPGPPGSGSPSSPRVRPGAFWPCADCGRRCRRRGRPSAGTDAVPCRAPRDRRRRPPPCPFGRPASCSRGRAGGDTLSSAFRRPGCGGRGGSSPTGWPPSSDERAGASCDTGRKPWGPHLSSCDSPHTGRGRGP